MEALKALLQEAVGDKFATLSRKHVMPPTLTPEQQPALFVCSAKDKLFRSSPAALTSKLGREVFLFVYAYDDAPDEVAGADDEDPQLLEGTLNQLLDAIEAALEPPPGEKQTLGGLVEHCWIEGEADIDPGFFTRQGFCILPVNILFP